MYFRLNPECYFIKGRSLGAIFDLIENKIYALDKEETEVLASCEKNLPISEDEVILKKLKQYRLGTFYTNRTYIYKIRAFNPAMEDVIANQPNLYRAFLEINNSCERDCWFCGLHGIRRSLGCMGCNKWSEGSSPVGIDRWKGLVDELRDLNCQNIFITGGDLTLAWDKTMEILDCAENKFNNIYVILHQESLSEAYLSDLNKKAKLIIQTESLNNTVAQESSIPLLIVKPEHWSDMDNLIVENKNLMLDFAIKDDDYTNDLPIISKKKIVMPGMIQFLHNMRYHPCIGNTLAISYTGNVLPCPMLRKHSFGNIRDREIYTLFEKGGSDKIDKFWNLTLDKIDKCKGCEFRYSCGDCRALEESKTRKLNGKEMCSYDPENGIWI